MDEASAVEQTVTWKLEKFDSTTGELLEVIEGGDGLDTKVTQMKENDNGHD